MTKKQLKIFNKHTEEKVIGRLLRKQWRLEEGIFVKDEHRAANWREASKIQKDLEKKMKEANLVGPEYLIRAGWELIEKTGYWLKPNWKIKRTFAQAVKLQCKLEAEGRS